MISIPENHNNISYSRFGVEVNVPPEPLGKLIVVYVSYKHRRTVCD